MTPKQRIRRALMVFGAWVMYLVGCITMMFENYAVSSALLMFASLLLGINSFVDLRIIRDFSYSMEKIILHISNNNPAGTIAFIKDTQNGD